MAKKGLYYAVTGSEHSGVFASYGEAQKCMRGQANAVVRKFMTREAVEFYLRTGKTLQFYVVKRGHNCGIFANYNDFAKQVYKYPGAVFQEFDWLPFAKLYYDLPDSSRVLTKKGGEKDGLLKGAEIVDDSRALKHAKGKWKEENEWHPSDIPGLFERLFLYVTELPQNSDIVIYTDGSANKRWYGWAYVAFWEERVIYAASGGGYSPDKRWAPMIAEMEAVKNAVLWAEMNRFRSAVIATDSQSVIEALESEKPIKGKTYLTDFLDWMHGRPLKNVEQFQFVKGHAGTLGNVMADYFAGVARRSVQPKKMTAQEQHG